MTCPADITDSQITFFPPSEPVMFDSQPQAYYPPTIAHPDTQHHSYYGSYYTPGVVSDQYTMTAPDGYWIQPQYTQHYPTVAPYSDDLHFDQYKEYMEGIDESKVQGDMPDGQEADVLQQSLSGPSARPLFEWRPHRLF